MKKKRSFETQLTKLSICTSLPLLLFLLATMLYAGISIWLILLTALVSSILVFYANFNIYRKLVYHFRGLNNFLDALTRGDYGVRARSNQKNGEWDELVASINGLAQRLSQQRRESVESQFLVSTIIEHIDVAIVALTEHNTISFLNPEAKKLLMLEQTDSDANLVEQLAFAQKFPAGHNQVVELSLGHRQGRFSVHVEEFRESSLQHKLLFITDVSTLLRSEERKAWQSLVRVLSHEINNSLSPIASISQTLNRIIKRESNGIEIKKDLVDGLAIITERANGLREFVDSYKKLAKLPEPRKHKVSVCRLIEKTSALFKHQAIEIKPSEDIELFIDPLQFEQVLINLIKNAIESMSISNPGGLITIEWEVVEPYFRLSISDQGCGISNPENLFVPFYSTKKNGSGIGLVLCRQIVEAHEGRLTIVNNRSAPGCCVSIDIPNIASKPM